jgi:hypothetical protein
VFFDNVHQVNEGNRKHKFVWSTPSQPEFSAGDIIATLLIDLAQRAPINQRYGLWPSTANHTIRTNDAKLPDLPI